jgi:hypothetical protein
MISFTSAAFVFKQKEMPVEIEISFLLPSGTLSGIPQIIR